MLQGPSSSPLGCPEPRRVCGKRDGTCVAERAGKLREDRQVGVQSHPLDPTHAQGRIAHSCLSRPNSRSTPPRLLYSALDRAVWRGMSGCKRSAFDPPLGRRHAARASAASSVSARSKRRPKPRTKPRPKPSKRQKPSRTPAVTPTTQAASLSFPPMSTALTWTAQSRWSETTLMASTGTATARRVTLADRTARPISPRGLPSVRRAR